MHDAVAIRASVVALVRRSNLRIADVFARGYATDSAPIFTFAFVLLQVFAGTYSIGLLFLRRQLAQERLGWNIPESVPVPLPVIGPGSRVALESVGARRRTMVIDSLTTDDGTHDMLSLPAWANTVGEDGGEARAERQRMAEMRQVQAVPVSLSAFI